MHEVMSHLFVLHRHVFQIIGSRDCQILQAMSDSCSPFSEQEGATCTLLFQKGEPSTDMTAMENSLIRRGFQWICMLEGVLGLLSGEK